MGDVMAEPTSVSKNAPEARLSCGVAPGERWLLTDRSLLVRAKQRDKRALSALCRVYWRPVYCYVRAHHIDHELALDITQGIFLNLFRRDLLTLDLERGSRFRSWLKRVAHRQVLNALKSKRRIGRSELPEEVAADASLFAVDVALQDRLFDRRTAQVLIERAWERLRRERFAERSVLFEHVRGHLCGERTALTHLELSRRLGQCDSYVGAQCNHVKNEEFPEAMRAELRSIGVSERRLNEELRALRDALA